MRIVESDKNIIIDRITDFSISQTLECGQCFHFIRIRENEYGIAAFGKMLHIRQEDSHIIFYNTTRQEFESIWKDYFDLDRDYCEIKDFLLNRDNKLKKAIDTMWGIRILKQDFFETLISFIISQNKQIGHIKQIVAFISKRWGNYLGKIGEHEFYSFPDCERMKEITEEELRACKTGFRAPYIIDAVRQIREGVIEKSKLDQADEESCRKELMQIKGVGEKVANCVILFGLHKRKAFPVDVWIKRIMEEMYFEGNTPNENITRKAEQLYGDFGGYAQQYLFYYGREAKIGIKQKSDKNKENKRKNEII